MKKLIAGVVLGVSLTAMAHGAGDPEAGEANAQVCAGCHGAGGAKPIAPDYPKLSNLGEKYLYQQLKLIKSGDRAIASMTGILDNRSDQDLQDLAAYFDSQDMPIGQADPDLVDQGESLYRGGNMATGVPACAACHSPTGNGIDAAGYPHLGGQSAAYVEKQLKAYRDGERAAGQNASIMMDVASKLTDQEIKAVSSYVSGLN
ncbi:c-type cytochrome [Marinobacter halotolerans]|uniref:c-type cytochrome n=1 Tax=Marinobacter halotolerans TaxID=1569211 RepID=UPI00124612A9|nr:c-type cytochrome [Marinobacter halotolerans]